MKLETNSIKYIASLTDINHHTGARIEASKMVGGELTAEYKDVEYLQNKLGYLTDDLNCYRHETDKELKEKIMLFENGKDLWMAL